MIAKDREAPRLSIGKAPRDPRALLCRAIAIGEKAYDAGHPNLGMDYWNLAQVEHRWDNLPEAIALYAAGRLKTEGRRVRILDPL